MQTLVGIVLQEVHQAMQLAMAALADRIVDLRHLLLGPIGDLREQAGPGRASAGGTPLPCPVLRRLLLAAALGQPLDHASQAALHLAADLAEDARRRFARLRRKLIERGRLAADIVAALVEHLFHGRHFHRHDGREPRVDVLARLG